MFYYNYLQFLRLSDHRKKMCLPKMKLQKKKKTSGIEEADKNQMFEFPLVGTFISCMSVRVFIQVIPYSNRCDFINTK